MHQSSQSHHKNKPKKPAKPYHNFPLFPHATGRWAKKIRGKLHSFGKWDAPQAALEKLNVAWPYLSQGRTPPGSDNGNCCTFKTLCNDFLNSKRRKMENDELSPRTFLDYHRACSKLIDYFGRERRVDDLRPKDFELFRSHLAQNIGMRTLRNRIGTIRVVFKFAFDQRSIKEQVHYGQSFDRPSAKALRKARNESGLRIFESEELLRILDAADSIMRAMVLLGINCGFGNTDVATLPQSAVNLDNGWIDFPRPKTEIHRRVPL
jgi:hypothetical protein